MRYSTSSTYGVGKHSKTAFSSLVGTKREKSPTEPQKKEDPLYLFRKAMEKRQFKEGWRKDKERNLGSFWHANKAIPIPPKKEEPRGNGARRKRKT